MFIIAKTLISYNKYLTVAVLDHTLHWTTRFIGPHAILDHTLYWTTRYIGPHAILDHTLYWTSRYIGPHAILDHTLHWTTRCIGPHAILDHTLYWTTTLNICNASCIFCLLLSIPKTRAFVSVAKQNWPVKWPYRQHA